MFNVLSCPDVQFEGSVTYLVTSLIEGQGQGKNSPNNKFNLFVWRSQYTDTLLLLEIADLSIKIHELTTDNVLMY